MRTSSTLSRLLLGVFLLAAASCSDDAPVKPPPPEDPCAKAGGPLEVRSIAADDDYSMAVMSDGTVRCWGFNVANRCAMPDVDLEVWPPRQSQGLECVTQVSLGPEGGAARRADGGLFVWSTDRHGELTQGYDVGPGVPVLIEETRHVRYVDSRNHTIHAVEESGAVIRWGLIWSEGLEIENEWFPTPIGALPPTLEVSAGAPICALTTDQTLWCWGGNAFGGLGDGTTLDRREPRPVEGLQVAAVRTGNGTSCALTPNQEVWCWGRNDAGQAGQPALPGEELEEKVLFPQRVEGLPPVVQIDLNDAATCAVTVDSEVYCWGVQGPCGLDGTLPYGGGGASGPMPTRIVDLSPARQVAMGNEHLCVLKTDGTVWCRGTSLATNANRSCKDLVLIDFPSER